MKLFAPIYYQKFRCIAEKCRHSCCVGWEIDIDEYTYSNYKKHLGVLKDRFKASIAVDDGTPHFILDENERCPFLNNENLCDIYTVLGEESLCQICTDHPRFRNFYSDRTEIGLGLCCEEACRIILKDKDVFKPEVIEDDCDYAECTDDEGNFFDIRQRIFDIISDRSKSIDARFGNIFDLLGIKPFHFDYANMFEDLEYMDNNVQKMIASSCNCNIPDTYLERLALYFIYRHLTGALDDGLLCERAVFAFVSIKSIEKMCASDSFDEVAECARIYSSEIEYSEENTQEILCRIGDLIEVSV